MPRDNPQKNYIKKNIKLVKTRIEGLYTEFVDLIVSDYTNFNTWAEKCADKKQQLDLCVEWLEDLQRASKSN